MDAMCAGGDVLLLPRRAFVALTSADTSLLLPVTCAWDACGTTGERFSLLPPNITRFSAPAAVAMRELWSMRRCLMRRERPGQRRVI